MSFPAVMSAGWDTNGAGAQASALPSRTGQRFYFLAGRNAWPASVLAPRLHYIPQAKGTPAGLGLVGFNFNQRLALLFRLVVVGGNGNRHGHRLGRLLSISPTISK